MSFAQIVLSGNVGGQIDTSPTPNGTERVRFSVAVNDRRTEAVAWYRVTAFGATAKGLTTLAQRGSLTSGAQVAVAGSLSPREYQDRAGQTKTSLDVTASEVQLLGSQRQMTDEPAPYATYQEASF